MFAESDLKLEVEGHRHPTEKSNSNNIIMTSTILHRRDPGYPIKMFALN